MMKRLLFMITFLTCLIATAQVPQIELVKRQAQGGDAKAMRTLGYLYQTGANGEANYEEAVKCYSQAAQTWPDAYNDLGWCLEHGLGVRQDSVKAFRAYTLAAEHGSPHALYNLSRCYEYAIGTTHNPEKAKTYCLQAAQHGNARAQLRMGYELIIQLDKQGLEWIHKAAQQGLPEAEYAMGCCLYEGITTKPDKAKALEWWRRAAKQDFAEAYFNLAWCYENGDGVQKDFATALKMYNKAALAGEADAQYHLGCFYYDGNKPGTQDYAEAVKWFTRAEKNGNLGGAAMLGECYYRGNGVKQDRDQAFEWLSRAVEDEEGYINPRAMRLLSACYRFGRGTDIDQQRANQLMEMAAEHGDTLAQQNLSVNGSVFENKPHTIPWLPIANILYNADNKQQATIFYQQAAQAGNLEAQYKLAYAYYNGLGVERKYSQAARWYRMAAAREYPPAQYGLAHCHIYGRGVPRNYQRALQLLELSASAGYRPAQLALAECYEKGTLTPKDPAKAEQWRQRAATKLLLTPADSHKVPDNSWMQLNNEQKNIK